MGLLLRRNEEGVAEGVDGYARLGDAEGVLCRVDYARLGDALGRLLTLLVAEPQAEGER